ncbi:hypothetical protein M3Y95_00626200 [Aphelenchoides besseyi]|nr:hypothetical protein M3Y95_00626200 [Aphelenchoides besseyi]
MSFELPSFSFVSDVREEVQITRKIVAECHEEDVDLNAVVDELKRHSTKIREAHEAVRKSRDELKEQVVELRSEVKSKEAELRMLNSWPLKIADDAKKWMDLWESDFGKRILNNQTSQLAENAIVVEQVGQTVDYCRRFIYAKRNSHEEWRKSSAQMRSFYESEVKRVQQEISCLRQEVTQWEVNANRNEVSVVELSERVKQLKLELMEKRTQLDEAKCDHREEQRRQQLNAIHQRYK